MPFKDFLELTYKYGSPVVYSAVFIFMLYKFGMKILDSYERREISYGNIINTGMAAITTSLIEINKTSLMHLQMYGKISQDVKDGFDRMLDANKYQRDEHKEILGAIADGESNAQDAREKILLTVKDGCKVK